MRSVMLLSYFILYRTSCTILINGHVVCVHDGTWKECEVCYPMLTQRVFHSMLPQEGHTANDFIRQINNEYERLNNG
jgi:hypothetical protein